MTDTTSLSERLRNMADWADVQELQNTASILREAATALAEREALTADTDWYRVCDEAWTALDESAIAEPDASLPRAIRKFRERAEARVSALERELEEARDEIEAQVMSKMRAWKKAEEAEEAARAERDAWKDTAVRHCQNELFYRGLVTQIGELFGVEARTSDDGSVQDSVLALKVSELVAKLHADAASLSEQLSAVQATLLEISELGHARADESGLLARAALDRITTCPNVVFHLHRAEGIEDAWNRCDQCEMESSAGRDAGTRLAP